jgi:hypothetical protein
MKFGVRQLSEHVVIVKAEVNDQVVEQLVADTVHGTKPVTLGQYVSDQGGIRPADAEPREPSDGGRVHP